MEHGRSQLVILPRQLRQAVQSPGLDELLRMLHVAQKDGHDAISLPRRPLKERECADHLQPDFPLFAVGERTDEETLIRFDPIRVLVRELLQQIDGAKRDEPVRVIGKGSDLRDPPGILLYEHKRPVGPCDRAPVSSCEKRSQRLRLARAQRLLLGEVNAFTSRS
jgi:hypothetical protein